LEQTLLFLSKELSEKLIFNLSDVELHIDHSNFVLISFTSIKNRIELTEILETQRLLVQKVKNKLAVIHMDKAYDEESLYLYKFTFEED
tara:strand:+ start:260 stop:526 length:267 start_codon:yes stop_codon:yes gene_type:complete